MVSRRNKMLIVNDLAPPRAPHSTSFTGPAPGLTGPSGCPRSPAVFSGRPHRASRPGRPRMDILSIRPLASRSARRWAKGSRSRKRRRVAPEQISLKTSCHQTDAPLTDVMPDCRRHVWHPEQPFNADWIPGVGFANPGMTSFSKSANPDGMTSLKEILMG